MSPSAITERVRRLEESGVITGYAAVLDPERLGLSIMAFVRLRYPTNNYKPFHQLLETTPAGHYHRRLLQPAASASAHPLGRVGVAGLGAPRAC
jgi:DNA-binding Lrp family transcriptional regulator